MFNVFIFTIRYAALQGWKPQIHQPLNRSLGFTSGTNYKYQHIFFYFTGSFTSSCWDLGF